MKSDIEKIYLIDRFLKGELSGLSLDEFKSKLRTDKEFAEEVESQKAIIEGIKMARKEHLISVLKGQRPPEIHAHTENPVESIPVTNYPLKEIPIINDDEIIPEEKPLSREYKLRPNYNNWAYAAVAVLFAGFAYYAIFGYYLPHQKLASTIDSSEVTKPQENTITPSQNDEEPELVENPNKKDSSIIETPASPLMAQGGDSMNVEKDKKIGETMYSVAAFESNNKIGDNNDDGKVSQKDSGGMKLGPVKKVRGASIKVEYWQSVVNFKGYKLSGSNLQLFDIKPEESVSFKYLDKHLFMKKNGNYYKLNASGGFEQYQKETNSETIKKLESN